MSQWSNIRRGLPILILAFIFSMLLPGAVTQASPANTGILPPFNLKWDQLRPETHIYADRMGPRSLALDTYMNGYAAFGGSHLYLYVETELGSSVETVDPAWGVGWYPSLVLDNNNNPRISYLDQLNYSVKYATKSGSTWSLETVDTVNIDNGNNSLALFPGEFLGPQTPGISYYAWQTSDSKGVLKYAYKTCMPFPCHWVREIVDSSSGDFIGEMSALGSTAGGKEVIAYRVSNSLHTVHNFKSGIS